GPSNLEYGLDNWYYGIVGYSGFEGTVAGEKLSFKQGFYRFKLERGARFLRAQDAKNESDGGGKSKLPKQPGTLETYPTVTKLEFLRSTSNNSWGLGISEEGHIFGSTANGCPSVHLTIP